jgi:hypothetical protein
MDPGSSLILLFNRTIPRWQMVLFLIIEGAGVGNVFQPTLVAEQAHSKKSNRAVVISVRKFLRPLGGSLGPAVSSAVFSNVLKRSLNSLSTPLPQGIQAEILASILRVPDLSRLSSIEKQEVLNAYMDASKGVFTVWPALMGVCLALCLLINDKGLTRPEGKVQQPEASGSGIGVGGESDVEMHVQEALRK